MEASGLKRNFWENGPKPRQYYSFLEAQSPVHHAAQSDTHSEEKDGVVGPFNDSATAQFFETCPECLSMVYRGKLGEFLLNYRKEGHHKDLEKIAEDHDEFNKQSKCLEIPLERPFIYKGEGDFCHQSPPIEVAVEAGDA